MAVNRSCSPSGRAGEPQALPGRTPSWRPPLPLLLLLLSLLLLLLPLLLLLLLLPLHLLLLQPLLTLRPPGRLVARRLCSREQASALGLTRSAQAVGCVWHSVAAALPRRPLQLLLVTCAAVAVRYTARLTGREKKPGNGEGTTQHEGSIRAGLFTSRLGQRRAVLLVLISARRIKRSHIAHSCLPHAMYSMQGNGLSIEPAPTVAAASRVHF